MIKKLLLIRKKDITSDLLDKAGLTQYVQGEPIPALPAAWGPTNDITHFGFVLHLRLKQWLDVDKWNKDKDSPEALLLELVEKDDDGKKLEADKVIEVTLKTVGLRVHPEATDDEE